MQDTRNVIDKFKGRSEAEIVKELDAKDHGLVIALENTERDFNMGTIVRSANAFGVRQIYVIGKRQYGGDDPTKARGAGVWPRGSGNLRGDGAGGR